jgi:hypothetical protein
MNDACGASGASRASGSQSRRKRRQTSLVVGRPRPWPGTTSASNSQGLRSTSNPTSMPKKLGGRPRHPGMARIAPQDATGLQGADGQSRVRRSAGNSGPDRRAGAQRHDRRQDGWRWPRSPGSRSSRPREPLPAGSAGRSRRSGRAYAGGNPAILQCRPWSPTGRHARTAPPPSHAHKVAPAPSRMVGSYLATLDVSLRSARPTGGRPGDPSSSVRPPLRGPAPVSVARSVPRIGGRSPSPGGGHWATIVTFMIAEGQEVGDTARPGDIPVAVFRAHADGAFGKDSPPLRIALGRYR